MTLPDLSESSKIPIWSDNRGQPYGKLLFLAFFRDVDLDFVTEKIFKSGYLR